MRTNKIKFTFFLLDPLKNQFTIKPTYEAADIDNKPTISFTLQEMSQDTSNDTISKLTAQRTTISELRAKVNTLEQTLASMVAEFERKKAEIKQRTAVRTQSSGVELDKLQKLLSVRDRELSRLKRVARSVVEQCSDTEILFHEALNHVKQEMLMHRCTSLLLSIKYQKILKYNFLSVSPPLIHSRNKSWQARVPDSISLQKLQAICRYIML